MVKVAINGFGRVGRITLRVILVKYLTKIKVVAINTSGSMPLKGWAHLFQYDSVYGQFRGKLEIEKSAEKKDKKEIGTLRINQQRIPFLAEREPIKIPWQKYNVETVIEATGVFQDRKAVSAHLEAGAKKVVVSTPSQGVDTFVIGANEDQYRNDLLVSNASCTTNATAPLVKIIKENFGLQKGLVTTIHAYTANQRLVDNSHQDLRRARAAAVNIIPTSTGADEATIEVLPSLKGLFNGLAMRVPVVCGSMIDLTLVTTKKTTVEAVNQTFIKASQGPLKGIVAVSDQPLVSSDILGNSASAIVDLNLTQVIDGDLIRIAAWYDNEWAYACRLIDLVDLISKK